MHMMNEKGNEMRDTRTFIPVADMIAALNRLPADAVLCVTQSGYYCYSDLADICFPDPVDLDLDDDAAAPVGPVYTIGHSHQSY
jgi:hypothetical protein